MSEIISAEAARQAVDHLDDCARMDVSVIAHGPVMLLLAYIDQREEAIAAAVAAEREACAKVAQEEIHPCDPQWDAVGNAIRARNRGAD